MRKSLELSDALAASILDYREQIAKLIRGEDHRHLIIVGPCSIHDEKAGLEYAKRLKDLAKEVAETHFLVMRVYFEKPRTTVGWKGMINDPHLDGRNDMEFGLKKARGFLIKIAEMGLPAATEFLDPIVPIYISDLVSWAAIGARTTESQTHREMASGLSMPVGFKNATDGSLEVAMNARISSSHPHSFLGINLDGEVSVVHTQGNQDTHIILRGGHLGPNYKASDILKAQVALNPTEGHRLVMVDCSHGNSLKDYTRQPLVFKEVMSELKETKKALLGMMLESHLLAGKQSLGEDLTYGQSITDGCIDMDETERLIREAHHLLKAP